tara:strand:- start:81 stop:746 length:666 start_codon:yes stop_codon:yes gene_type:complete
MVDIDNTSMIGWLRGRPKECWTQGNHSGILLVCSHVGYEVHLTSRHQQQLKMETETELWVHQVQRDDGSSLFGFPDQSERDLFRRLIGVSGVGPQAGMSLLQECTVNELIEAICSGDLRRLCRAQGIGKRTAERLAVELRTSLAESFGRNAEPSLVEGASFGETPAAIMELEETLSTLGYEDLEIRRAIRSVQEGQTAVPPDDDSEAWIRACLQWLSRDSA